MITTGRINLTITYKFFNSTYIVNHHINYNVYINNMLYDHMNYNVYLLSILYLMRPPTATADRHTRTNTLLEAELDIVYII